jgi:Tol biopolymer transport system component
MSECDIYHMTFTHYCAILLTTIPTQQRTTARGLAPDNKAHPGGNGEIMNKSPTIFHYFTVRIFLIAALLLPLGMANEAQAQDENPEAPFQTEAPQTMVTGRVSISTGGTQGNEQSINAAISGDGRFVAFVSLASTLVSGDTNGVRDIFVRDRQTGQTSRVSVSSSETQGNDHSYNLPAISADGRYVAFQSLATNLVSGDTNGFADIFVRDLQSRQTSRVSVSSSNVQGNIESEDPAISADGNLVAFTSGASNLIGVDTNGKLDIFVHDQQSGQTKRVSVSSGGVQGNGNSRYPSISADGRFVAFQSDASNLVSGDTNGFADIFVHDRQTGQTTRASISSNGIQGNGDSGIPAMSANGRYVAFESLASNMDSGDTNGTWDVYMRDLQTGQTNLISISSSGIQGHGRSENPAISADGRFVAFESLSSNLVSGDTNHDRDIFVHDGRTGLTERLSISSSGYQANDLSLNASISATGNIVAFESYASNLVMGDTNGFSDAFVRTQPVLVLYLPIVRK